MQFLDDLIVTVATFLLRSVLVAGTALVYVQFVAIGLVLSVLGAGVVAALLMMTKAAFFGG